ncbi:salivary peroxidase/catechol oxidase-like isoform X2 [Panulirus ornatus]|uniref:salivary peroxidase/catechol oxidase-like isoform X2 n=1 Tax=Panulirus ornatus TaxID=150431 RepID=UPI003A8C0EB6
MSCSSSAVVRWLVWLCVASTIWAQLDNLRPLRGVLHNLGGPEQQGGQQGSPVPAQVLSTAAAAAAFDDPLDLAIRVVSDPVDLTEALEFGLTIAEEIIDQETGGGALRSGLGASAAAFQPGLQLSLDQPVGLPPPVAITPPLEQSSVFLFSFRKAELEAKRSASCQGRVLLEASKFLTRTNNIAVQDAQQSLTEANSFLDQSMCQVRTPRQCEAAEPPPRCSASQTYRTIDGSCNNLQNPKWGESMIPFVRYLAPAYEDGLDAMRGEGRTGDRVLPSPRDVSRMLHDGEQRQPLPYLTLLVMQWGQFLDHDLVHTPEAAVDVDGETMPLVCCREGVPSPEDDDLTGDCRPIDVSADPLFASQGRSCMRFVRSLIASRDCLLGPREQLNQVTAYIDGSMVYGSTPEVARMLRTMVGGKLNKTAMGPGERHFLPLEECEHSEGFCFKAGDERVNEQPALASMHTLWLRVHDSIVIQLAGHNPQWDDETLYQETRRIVGALIQQITYQEFLPVVLGNERMVEYDLFPETSGLVDTYDPSIDASIANAFGTAAYRFGHTLVNDFLKGSGGKSVPLSGNFMNPRVLGEAGSSPSDLLHGLANSLSQAVDAYLVPTLTNKLFARRDEPVGLDLMSLNIQRGRDHGLPSYTVWRRACGLPTLSSFSQLASVMTPSVAQIFSRVYRNVDDIDLFPAGLAEHATSDALLGPTFSCILAQQFSSLKKGDRFWFENRSQPKPFSQDQLASIRSLSLASLMCEHMNLRQLQPHPFLTPDVPGNHPQPCSTYPKLRTRLWREEVVVPVPPPDLPCHGVGVWRSLPGIDYWCTLNCLRHTPFCPSTHCYCSASF